MRVRLRLDDKVFDVELERSEDGWDVKVDGEPLEARCDVRGAGTTVQLGSAAHHVQRVDDALATIDGVPVAYGVVDVAGAAGLPGDGLDGNAQVKPPMAGTLERIDVAPGDTVQAGDVLFVLEAMKMRNEVRAPIDGQITAVHAEAGRSVDTSLVVVEIEAS